MTSFWLCITRSQKLASGTEDSLDRVCYFHNNILMFLSVRNLIKTKISDALLTQYSVSSHYSIMRLRLRHLFPTRSGAHQRPVRILRSPYNGGFSWINDRFISVKKFRSQTTEVSALVVSIRYLCCFYDIRNCI